MRKVTRQILNAAILTTILAIAGLMIKMRQPGMVDGMSLSILLPSFFVTISLALIIFNAGLSKPDDTSPLYTLSAIGLKFFLAAILSLVYFVALKKTELRFVILFFILYLAFTFYLLRVILKTLKNKSLKKN
jgi:drug/metabolite transporter (DMT)-like permease